MNLIIIGASGLVGQEFIKLISQDEHFPNNFNIILVGSNNSKGTYIEIKEKFHTIITLDDINWYEDSIYINCADKEQAKEISTKKSFNSILIDNSSYYRLNEYVPLVIPEINFPIEKYNIYANPNCSTIILNLLLKPLLDNFGIRRVVVSTYQAASGAGKDGVNELVTQMGEMYLFQNPDSLTKTFWKKQYIYNTFVHNSLINIKTGYNEEEEKIVNETNKIFNRNIPISATCIRVPVLRSHCESVNVELEKGTNYTDLLNILQQCDYLEIMDDKQNKIFPESITSNTKMKVQVGHIREDFSLDKGKGWNFWISSDQLLRGAAGNAYNIFKKLI
jgi:aspartate-semialdehyde dehydrogenase